MNKTKVEIQFDDTCHNDWKKGERGYIDGYIYTTRSLIVVIINERIVLIPFGNTLKVL